MTAQILNIPPEEYHARKALSNTGISKLLDCPAKFKAWLDGGQDEQTEAMLIGSAFHCLALEPGRFRVSYHVMVNSGTTKAANDERAQARQEGKTILNKDQSALVTSLAAGLMKHKVIAKRLNSHTAQKELSIFWTEEVDGFSIPCKARLDLFDYIDRFGTVGIDLKSMQNAAPASLSKTINDRGYHRQAWWYLRALNQAGHFPAGFFLATVEKSAPYLASFIRIKDEAIEKGGRECAQALTLFSECAKANHWPGYSQEIIEVDLPDWIYRKEMNNETHGQFAE